MADQETRRALHFTVDIQADDRNAAAKALRAAADAAERGVTFGVGIGKGYDYSIDRTHGVSVVQGEVKAPRDADGLPLLGSLGRGE
jgi:hypothetical protein